MAPVHMAISPMASKLIEDLFPMGKKKLEANRSLD